MGRRRSVCRARSRLPPARRTEIGRQSQNCVTFELRLRRVPRHPAPMTPSAPSFAHEKREFATELKFLLDPATADAVRTWAREHLVADPHATGPHGDNYQISSLYYDT